MGGDEGPRLVVPAVLEALNLHPDMQCELHGDAGEIEPFLARVADPLSSRLRVVHTDHQVAMDDKPANALRRGRTTSMWTALDAVASGRVHGCVSAGNTGALMLMSLRLLETLPGIERPAICTALPTHEGKAYLLDMGANLQCSAAQLLQFGRMASAMVAQVDGCAAPRVGLVNVGSEAGKGEVVVQEAAALMAADDSLNYCGYVEGDAIFSGDFDVIVCDGFVGNVALKTTEGVARLIAGMVREELTDTLRARLGAAIARPALSHLQNRLNPANYNGASLLGLNKTVVKSHGGASAAGLVHAIGVARREIQNNVPARIADKLGPPAANDQ